MVAAGDRRADLQFKAPCFKLFSPQDCRNLAPTSGGRPQRFVAIWAEKECSRQKITPAPTIDVIEQN